MVFSVYKRQLYFLFGCIPARIFLVLLAFYIPEHYMKYLGILFLILSLGFLSLYFTNSRLKAKESGGKTWWHGLRLLHGVLFMTAAIYAFQHKNYVWIPLLIDVILGFLFFIFHHVLGTSFL